MTSPAARDDARLFIALWPDPSQRAALAAQRDAWRWPAGAKPVPDEKLHLTLHFIGSFARAAIDNLGDRLADVTLPALAVHPHASEIWRGGIAVLRLDSTPGLLELHERLGAVLGAFDVALDPRPFAPHVTMARKAQRAEAPAEPGRFTWIASGFALVESHRGGSAPYQVLRRFGRP